MFVIFATTLGGAITLIGTQTNVYANTALEEAGLECVDWNVDSLDWSKSSADAIFNQVVADLKHSNYPNEVVLLFHEKKLTLEVLPRVIEYYRNQGYVFMPYYEGEEFDCMKK